MVGRGAKRRRHDRGHEQSSTSVTAPPPLPPLPPSQPSQPSVQNLSTATDNPAPSFPPKGRQFHLFGNPVEFLTSYSASLAEPDVMLDSLDENTLSDLANTGSDLAVSSVDSMAMTGLMCEQAASVPDHQAALAPAVPDIYKDSSVTSRYPHVDALMNLIDLLETHIQLPAISVDRALRVNRHVMAKLPAVMALDSFRMCRSCPALVANIVDMAVGLYQNALRDDGPPRDSRDGSLTSDGDPGGSSASPARSSAYSSAEENGGGSGLFPGDSRPAPGGAPVLQFGCLELSPEEQALLRNQIVRRDLQKCLAMIEACKSSSRPETTDRDGFCDHGTGRDPAAKGGKAHAMWYSEIEQQARELLASVVT